jgi:glutamate-1-semialdehyde aminotransferase
MVRFARTGGEAMAVAVRIARAATRKDVILFCGYHGWSDWYLAANLSDDKALDGQLLPGLQPAGVPRQLKGTAFPFTYNNTAEFLALVRKHGKEIGGVAVEAVRNVLPHRDFLDALMAETRRLGVPLIVDEVSSGWRLNLGGAHLTFGLEPDIAVFAKGMGNGYSIAAITGKSDFMDAAQISFISSTYWTDRTGPTAALATIEKMKRVDAQVHMVECGKKIQAGWTDLAAKHHLAAHVSGIFPLSHIEFEYKNPLVMKTLFTQLMLERGFLATNAYYASYAHKDTHIKAYLEAVDECFGIMSKAAAQGNAEEHLKGPVCHSGFRRLT